MYGLGQYICHLAGPAHAHVIRRTRHTHMSLGGPGTHRPDTRRGRRSPLPVCDGPSRDARSGRPAVLLRAAVPSVRRRRRVLRRSRAPSVFSDAAVVAPVVGRSVRDRPPLGRVGSGFRHVGSHPVVIAAGQVVPLVRAGAGRPAPPPAESWSLSPPRAHTTVTDRVRSIRLRSPGESLGPPSGPDSARCPAAGERCLLQRHRPAHHRSAGGAGWFPFGAFRLCRFCDRRRPRSRLRSALRS